MIFVVCFGLSSQNPGVAQILLSNDILPLVISGYCQAAGNSSTIVLGPASSFVPKVKVVACCTIAAENILLRQQLIALSRHRKRSPKL